MADLPIAEKLKTIVLDVATIEKSNQQLKERNELLEKRNQQLEEENRKLNVDNWELTKKNKELEEEVERWKSVAFALENKKT